MGKKCLLGLLLVVTIVAMTGCFSTVDGNSSIDTGTPTTNSSTNTPSDDNSNPNEIKLSQTIIDEAVAQCQDKTTWGINLADVHINYMVGVGVEAAIVLHNGDDASRLITLKYQPVSQGEYDGETGAFYDPAPIAASGWVTIDAREVRLEPMETKVVKTHLFVPEGTDIKFGRWEFYIEVTGAVISQGRDQFVQVITDREENTLEVILSQPLLQDDISAVLSIASSISENPYAMSYDTNTRILTIGGVRESANRDMTVTYEHGGMLQIAYTQRYFIVQM